MESFLLYNRCMKAILFDFDGTLSNRYVCVYRMFRHIIEQVMPDADFLEQEKVVQQCIYWDEYGNQQKTGTFTLLKQYYISDLDVNYWVKYWRREFCHYMELMPGAGEVLPILYKKYKLGILSNGDSASQHAKIDALHLEKYFPVVIASWDYGIDKPDPEIYRIAAEKLGVDCKDCYFVGDTFMTDIYGAIKAGMHPVWLSYERRAVSQYPADMVSSWQELASLLIKKEGE